MSISTCALREEGNRLLKAQKEGKLYISIHALREEGDMYSARAPRTSRHFYPRPPRGGRHPGRVSTGGQPNFYPRPPRGGRLKLVIRPLGGVGISIHALREEGDAGWGLTFDAVNEFLSTPSARRATGALLVVKHPERFLSTPSARRATAPVVTVSGVAVISIHALREEGDMPHAKESSVRLDFYPRPPRGGRPIIL